MFSINRFKAGNEQLRQLQSMAYSGNFDCHSVDRIASGVFSNGKISSKSLAYFVSSLYLQIGETESANRLLVATGRASREMKWFCMVLLHCRANELPVPHLSDSDRGCLDYLQNKICPPGALADLFVAKDNFCVVGNAPGTDADAEISLPDDCVSIFFNNYHLNPGIPGRPTIHMVTPSWRPVGQSQGDHLCITGNSIFYRRSKVWRRFASQPAYVGIHTMPRQLWASLVAQLDAPPSAGLLALAFIEKYLNLTGKSGLIAGFSDAVSSVNHSYDKEPLSQRHNWQAEVALRRRTLALIARRTTTLRDLC